MKTEAYLLAAVLVILIGVSVFFAISRINQTPPEQSQNGDLSLSSEKKTNDVTMEDKNSPQTTMAPNGKNLPEPSMTIDTAKTYTATLKTTEGDIIIELNAAQTPITVNNFVYLARESFYNNTIFHRVIENFMIQGGDPTGIGSGGPGYRFDDEPFEGEYTRGTVAMANSGPDTNGSQFFIMHGDTELRKDYVIFGRVSEGMDVVDKIATAQVTANAVGEPSKPVNPVKITSVEIVEE